MSKIVEKEIVAAIAAAIQAYSQNNGYSLVVKKIKRLEQTSPIWGMNSRVDLMRNKLV